jgi:sugar lactone lactonase YvrE
MKERCIAMLTIGLSFYGIAESQTTRINFKAPKLYPEGTAYYPAKKIFFVSSVRTGTIGTVDEKGTYKIFYEDPTLKSSYGMKVDQKRNKLWVCTGDANYSIYADSATFKKMIRLIGLDLNTGKKTDDIDLSNLVEGKHFANDITLDEKGNIYITDSYSPVIYKVDPQMKPGILVRSDLFKGGDVGLNGIVWSSQGYLIVAHNTKGQLFKIDLMQPGRITKIQVNTFFPGADGLLWDASGNLVLIQNKGVNKTFQLSSKDGWQSAEVKGYTLVEDRLHQPTTATMNNGQVYVLNSKMNELTDPTAMPSKEFSLQQVRFVSAK